MPAPQPPSAASNPSALSRCVWGGRGGSEAYAWHHRKTILIRGDTHPYPHNPRSRNPLPQAFTAPPLSTEAAIPPGQPPQEVAIAPSPKAPPASPRSTAAFTSGNQEVP